MSFMTILPASARSTFTVTAHMVNTGETTYIDYVDHNGNEHWCGQDTFSYTGDLIAAKTMYSCWVGTFTTVVRGVGIGFYDVQAMKTPYGTKSGTFAISIFEEYDYPMAYSWGTVMVLYGTGGLRGLQGTGAFTCDFYGACDVTYTLYFR